MGPALAGQPPGRSEAAAEPSWVRALELDEQRRRAGPAPVLPLPLAGAAIPAAVAELLDAHGGLSGRAASSVEWG
eukprot:12724049-Alexandrium_andersonii.AAC.1